MVDATRNPVMRQTEISQALHARKNTFGISSSWSSLNTKHRCSWSEFAHTSGKQLNAMLDEIKHPQIAARLAVSAGMCLIASSARSIRSTNFSIGK